MNKKRSQDAVDISAMSKLVQILLIVKTLAFIQVSGYTIGKCKWEGNSINCSKRNLTDVPTYAKTSLTKLDLSGNNISEIGRKSFENYTQMIVIDLSLNNIALIEEDSFAYLGNLSILILSGNKLTSFRQNMNTLMRLSLRDNPLTDFKSDSEIQALYLENTSLTKIPQLHETYGLTRIGLTLSRYSTDDFVPYCKLQGWVSETVNYNSSIVDECSCVRYNNWKNSTKGKEDIQSYSYFHPINTLCPRSRKYNCINGSTTYDETTMKKIDTCVEKSNVGMNRLRTKCKKYSNQQESIQDCRNMTLKFHSPEGYSNTTVLLLQENDYSEIGYLFFPRLKELKILNLANNNISSIHVEAFKGLEKLESVNLGNNRLKEVYTNFPKTLKHLDLSFNIITKLYKSSLKNYTNLEWLDVRSNNISDVEYKTLERVSDTRMKLLSWSNPLKKFSVSVSRISELYLNYTEITEFPKLYNLSSFEKLDLSNTGIKNMTVSDIEFLVQMELIMENTTLLQNEYRNSCDCFFVNQTFVRQNVSFIPPIQCVKAEKECTVLSTTFSTMSATGFKSTATKSTIMESTSMSSTLRKNSSSVNTPSSTMGTTLKSSTLRKNSSAVTTPRSTMGSTSMSSTLRKNSSAVTSPTSTAMHKTTRPTIRPSYKGKSSSHDITLSAGLVLVVSLFQAVKLLQI